MQKAKNVYSFLLYSLLMAAVYAALIFPAASANDYLAGVILAPLSLLFALKISSSGLRYFSLKNLIWFIAYVPYLLYKIIQANVDVAVRVLKPSLPINPGFVKIKCTSDDNLLKLMLSNSITLTPGTLTMDIKDGYLIVHTIDETAYKDREEIKAGFTRYLKEME